MKKTSVLNVLYQSDDNYAAFVGISLTSLFINNQNLDEINVYLLNNQIKEANINKIKRTCKEYKRKLKILNAENVLKRIKNYDLPKFHGGYSSYLKLFVFNQLHLKGDLLFYIDGDTIINGNLGDLLNTDVEGFLFGAVCETIFHKYKLAFNIPKNEKYVNTGFFLLNLKEWKKQNCEKKIEMQAMNVKLNYKYADQDLINTLFYDKVKRIDLRYNFNPAIFLYGIDGCYKLYNLDESYYSKQTVRVASENVVIYHCLPGMMGRPWEQNNNHPYKEIFLKYKNISLWKDMPLKKTKQALFYKIQKFMYLYFPRKIYLYIHKQALHYECNKLLKENKKYFISRKRSVK